MQLSALLSGGLLVISLAACQSGTFSESIVGSGLLGDHFGVPSFNGSFDYVVIGGGTAGLAIASRLAGNGSHSVAVIEKGSFYELDNGNFSTVPGTAGYFVGTAPFTFNSLIDWEYQTQPIQVCPIVHQRRLLLRLGAGSRRSKYTLQLRENSWRRKRP